MSGKCRDCGALAARSRCERCAKAKREKESERKALRKARGQCIRCEDFAVPGRNLCERHQLVETRRSTARAAAFEREGRCRCGRERAPGLVACSICAEKNKARAAVERKNKDLCSQCRNRRRAAGYATCQECRAKHARRNLDRSRTYVVDVTIQITHAQRREIEKIAKERKTTIEEFIRSATMDAIVHSRFGHFGSSPGRSNAPA